MWAKGGAKRKKEDAETKIDKTSLWIPAACAAGRPHCSKCPARYEIMSVRIPRHGDNLSRLHNFSYLSTASQSCTIRDTNPPLSPIPATKGL